ncbi:hypothetical protein ACFLTB_02760 [Chloroflexota bacterium]
MDSNKSLYSKEQILKLIKIRTNRSDIKLPGKVDFQILQNTLFVKINTPETNMQTDDAAFEGWVLPIKVLLSDIVAHVELDYSSCTHNVYDRLGKPKGCHFNRFLYRVNNFSRLFPSWFNVAPSKENEIFQFIHWLRESDCILNHPLRDRTSVFNTTNNMERNIESWFRFHDGQRLICDLWGIDNRKLFNQLPAGLFLKTILAEKAIFTRANAAVDLGGLSTDGSTLHLIELKCGENKGMGVISEILFYTFLFFDTCILKDRYFKFGKYKNASQTIEMEIIQNEGIRNLSSHILAECYHPLFSSEMLSLLKDSLQELGISFSRAQYNFEKKVIISDL